MVGIISNSAALFAQRNLTVSNTQSENSIARLSSGERIIRASDDVAGLAIGTALSTNVSTLRTALTSTSQANSLLAIADGGLKNIGDILSRQKSLAVQANSGTVSDNERAFLNEEFTNLTLEINRLVDATNFNGIKLLDGSLGGISGVTTATGATTETFSLNALTDYSVNGVAAGAIDGVAVAGGIETAYQQFIATVDIAGSDADDTFTIAIGGDTTAAISTVNGNNGATAQNAIEALENLSGTTKDKYVFTAQGSRIFIALKDESLGDPGADQINITRTGDAVTFNLNGGALANNTNTALDTAIGGGGSQDFTAQVTDTSAPFDNTDIDTALQGGITNLQATYLAGNAVGTTDFVANRVQFTATVNGQTYVSDEIALTDAGITYNDGTNAYDGFGTQLRDNQEITFRQVGTDATSQLSFRLTTNGTQSITNQTSADTVATTFQTALTSSTVEFYQSREVSGVSTTAIAGTLFEGLTSSSVALNDNGFAADGTLGNVGNFNIDRTNNQITVTVNDVLYTAGLTNATQSGTASISDGVSFTADGTLVFTTADTADARTLTIDFDDADVGNAFVFTFNNAADEANLESLFNSFFDVGDSGSLTFQVGQAISDTIGVTISSAKTTDLYIDDNGAVQTLSVDTAANAQTASDVLDNAINTVTSLRATVGALQSRFDFAAANISAAIQNTEAARSDFLDVDVADESTAFATSQVRLQASISVLAQANLLPQNLLKLIG